MASTLGWVKTKEQLHNRVSETGGDGALVGRTDRSVTNCGARRGGGDFCLRARKSIFLDKSPGYCHGCVPAGAVIAAISGRAV
jgi:hypothetical protein